MPSHYRALTTDRSDVEAMRKAIREAQPEVALDFIGYDLSEAQADFELFKNQVRQFIFISSATVYRKPAPRLPITETSPLGNDWWEYARKKLACEEWFFDRHRQDGFPVTVVRPSHTYSHGWVPNVISSAGYSLVARMERGDAVFVPDQGESLWTLTAASDFAVGLAGLIGNDRAIGEAFHITSDEALTWRQIYSEIAAAAGVESPRIVPVPTEFICQIAPELTGGLRGDKSHPSVFDNDKVKALVPQFRCKVPFREGIRESVSWLRANPSEQKLNPKIDHFCDVVISEWEKRKRE